MAKSTAPEVSLPAARRSPRPRRLTRAEKSEATLRALFRAAVETVGRYGYEGASVSRITQKAQVAQGTFYNYFENQQDLFDQLLPTLGKEMLAFIKAQIGDATDVEERERRSFIAFYEFIGREPYFFRILYEAETFAPKGYREHMKRITQSYAGTLRRQRAQGSHPGFSDRELDVIVHVLTAARASLGAAYLYAKGKKSGMPPWVTEAFMKFVMHGLKGMR